MGSERFCSVKFRLARYRAHATIFMTVYSLLKVNGAMMLLTSCWTAFVHKLDRYGGNVLITISVLSTRAFTARVDFSAEGGGGAGGEGGRLLLE